MYFNITEETIEKFQQLIQTNPIKVEELGNLTLFMIGKLVRDMEKQQRKTGLSETEILDLDTIRLDIAISIHKNMINLRHYPIVDEYRDKIIVSCMTVFDYILYRKCLYLNLDNDCDKHLQLSNEQETKENSRLHYIIEKRHK